MGKEPLQFTVGESHISIKGLEDSVIGMEEGERKTVIIPPDLAFGQRLGEKIHVIDRAQFPAGIQPAVGLKFEIRQENGELATITVSDVSETRVTLDANHPLAGKNLKFDIELLEVIASPSVVAEDYYKTAVDLQGKGLLDEAMEYYQKAIDQNPNLAAAYFNMGVALQQKEQIDKAIIYYEIAIGLNQEFVEAHHNLGIALKDKGLFDDAVLCFQRSIQLKPDHADAYYNLGNTLVAKGLFENALQSYNRAIEISPDHADAHWSIALLKLRSGDFEEGWKGYEWRWKINGVIDRRDFVQPLWDGADISGKTIFLHSEQGFGDTIQFIRYAREISALGGKVIFECQKELVSLLGSAEGVARAIPPDSPPTDFNLHCPLLSLPYIFRTTLDTVPAKIPYIKPDPGLVRQWQGRIMSADGVANIGLVWAGNPKLKFGHSRSCPLEAFAPLAHLDNIALFSLQIGDASGYAKNPPEGLKIIDYTGDIRDFSDTAAIIQNLDLVISVDTAVAHLAGALGKPVWVLLPFVPDWRWMKDREDSPWYPTMRLFRQSSSGDWQSLMGRVEEALREFTG